jgi:hypothetical protein
MKTNCPDLAVAALSCFAPAMLVVADFDRMKPWLRATVDAHDGDSGEPPQ